MIFKTIQEDLDKIKEMLDTLYGTKDEKIDIDDDPDPDLDDWVKYN